MLTNIERRTKETAIDVVNAMLGLCLALSPWPLEFTSDATATWNAVIVGIAVALIAVGALMAFNEWEEWANLVLGIWAGVAPWVLGFAATAYAAMAHVTIGVIVAVLAALELWFAHKRPVSPA